MARFCQGAGPSTHANQAPHYGGGAGNLFADPYATEKPTATATSGLLRGQRRRVDLVSIFLSLIVPWALYMLVSAVCSFSMHYQQPLLVYVLLGAGLLLVLLLGAKAWTSARFGGELTWMAFVFLSCLLAWMAGVFVGDWNFYHNMQPYYDVASLEHYSAVDPSQMKGNQVMDAGRVIFTEGARLDFSKAMAFRNLDTYCVAPVTIGNPAKNGTAAELSNYDFWAVGLNCCGGLHGQSADFRCGESSNPVAHAGLRLMNDDQRAFFRLAVQQAEASFGIVAHHPVFFYWMQDPSAELNAYQDGGSQLYLLAAMYHFAIQLFMVLAAVLCFSRFGSI